MATDPRIVKSRKKIIDTTIELIKKEGIDGVSIEKVSLVSGVAKTTIYRQWRSADELILETISNFDLKASSLDTGNIDLDVFEYLCFVSNALRTSPELLVLPDIISKASRNKAYASLCKEIYNEISVPLESIIERGQERQNLVSGNYKRLLSKQLLSMMITQELIFKTVINDNHIKTAVTGTLKAYKR